jgi:hypothetical protein
MTTRVKVEGGTGGKGKRSENMGRKEGRGEERSDLVSPDSCSGQRRYSRRSSRRSEPSIQLQAFPVQEFLDLSGSVLSVNLYTLVRGGPQCPGHAIPLNGLSTRSASE